MEEETTVLYQKIRAKITFGNIIVETPYVVSFNVRKARGQMAATFSASIKVPADTFSGKNGGESVGSAITIEAGAPELKKIFTGRIFKVVTNPIFTDSSLVMVNLSGRDVLSLLEGQKVTRLVDTLRDQEGNSPGRWGVITSVTRSDQALEGRFYNRLYTSGPVAVPGRLPSDFVRVIEIEGIVREIVPEEIRFAMEKSSSAEEGGEEG